MRGSRSAPPEQTIRATSTFTYALTSQSWLLGDWDGDSAYDDDPASRATFGIFKGSDMLIYSREIY